MVRETRNWFNHSPQRQDKYTNLYKAINADKTPLSLSKLCDTRWLAWAMPVKSTVDQWLELKTHFQIAAVADKNAKCYIARDLARMYADNNNMLYFLFLNEILPDINSLNKSFQSSNADVTKLYTGLKVLLFTLLKRFIKPIYLNNKEELHANNSLGMLHQRDLDTAQKALEKADLNRHFDTSLLPLESMDMGQGFENFLVKQNITKESRDIVLTRCSAYLIRLCKELIKRIPQNLKILTNMRYLNPNALIGSPVAHKNFGNLPWELAKKDYDTSILQAQWRKLCSMRLQDLSSELHLENLKNPEKPIDSIKFWIAVKKCTNASGEKMFEKIADFALRVFSLPISNAVVERVFSIMNLIKTKLRNRMTFCMLEAILRIRIHLKVIGKCCHSYRPSKKMLFLFNSQMYNQNDSVVLQEEEVNTEEAFLEAVDIFHSID